MPIDKTLKKRATHFKESVQQHLRYSLAREGATVTARDFFVAAALAARDRMVDILFETEERYRRVDAKRLYYLSAEFLLGQSLEVYLHNLGLHEVCQQVAQQLGVNFQQALDSEPDAALGNGGLGRLAACFLDSLASLDMPGFGYGINYEYGLFRQELANGYQRELPDNWITWGTPWQVERPDEAVFVPLYGRIEHSVDRDGNYNPMWLDWQLVIGIPHDMYIPGYGRRTVNYLRLFSARPSHEFDMQIFNEGDYFKAIEQKIVSEYISKILYPSDTFQAGRELRLIQEHFLVSCAVRDIVNRYQRDHKDFGALGSKVAIHLNDTHPALAVAELMRILVDEKGVPWATAWDATRATLAFTNHTLMPEALERWPVPLFERVLPRHLQIVYEINRRFLDDVYTVWSPQDERVPRVSIIEESQPKQVRMANLAVIGSHSVNGVSALHSELVKRSLFPDFYQLSPEKFNNKTNGVTHRRFLLKANPLLSGLITRTIGDGWITDLSRLSGLRLHAEDPAFQEEVREINTANKERLAGVIRRATGLVVDPESLFDIHAKRIHEYKRQLLKVLQIVDEYFALLEDSKSLLVPKTYVFAGKAAPGYWVAKQIIKLITSVGAVINHDPNVAGRIRVVFVPDYRVSFAETIIPAADLSEQISTAGTEASGTGNMKFAMNGALTIGTLDGANIEIRQEVGEENFYAFGLNIEQVETLRRSGSYRAWDLYHGNPRLKRVLDALHSDLFCPHEHGLFHWVRSLLLDQNDHYLALADFQSYVDTQAQVARDYRTPDVWARKVILNMAAVGKFSSDRTVLEYAREIWGIERQA